ncbi:hypothetical protein [Streptomyces hainanensis]|uniref:Uncharacterized protein n=1 Tax=Streptomyces hainanensis TaxID=402648 RepID=A0A4R4TFF0_9ACTN|nr:hypothetical protein [Streptomyces hainanensis]TDC76160.1 hypothetical protein E1283_10445 [Streptomyces hainanensis]
MSAIATLWARESLPIKDGLYLASGESVAAELAPGSARGAVFLDPFDLDALLRADPEWVTEIDVAGTLRLEDGGMLCCGQGSYGSEGFFARIGEDGAPRWGVYFEESNPFHEIAYSAGHATFGSTSGVRITVDIRNPRLP